MTRFQTRLIPKVNLRARFLPLPKLPPIFLRRRPAQLPATSLRLPMVSLRGKFLPKARLPARFLPLAKLRPRPKISP